MRDNYRAWGSALGRLDLCSARQSVFFFSWIEYQLISWVICCSGNWVKGWEHTQHIQPSHPENGRKKRESVVWVSLRRHFGWCRIIWISHAVVGYEAKTWGFSNKEGFSTLYSPCPLWYLAFDRMPSEVVSSLIWFFSRDINNTSIGSDLHEKQCNLISPKSKTDM